MARRTRKTAKAGEPAKFGFMESLTVTELLAKAGKPVTGRTAGLTSQMPPSAADSSWDSGLDYAGALAAARDGLEPSREFTLSADRFQRIAHVPSITYRHDVAGDELDVGRYLEGEAECFLEPQLTTREGVPPIVEVLVSIAASCAVSARTIERRGAAIFALVDSLEKSGKAVGVTISSAIDMPDGSGNWYDSQIRVKHPYEHVNPRRLYYFLTHPTVLRRLVFRLREMLAPEIRDSILGNGYGKSADARDVPPGTLYIPRIDGDTFDSSETTEAWIKGVLEAQGATNG